MKLIKENITFNDIEVLTEGSGADKRLHIKGPFLQAEKVNRNNRVYPQGIMDKAVNKYIKEYVNKNRALGELNHPAEPIVNPERAAIMTTSLKKNGVFYEGIAKVLTTPMGKIVQNLLDDGVTIGVSSRGLGSLKQHNEGYNEVQSDFIITTAADVVFDPSAQTAFVEGIMEESEWIYESGMFRHIELHEQRDIINNTKKRHLQEAKLRLWKKLCHELSI